MNTAPTLLTVFTAPKPFLDPHIATIQRNAIQSWKALGPQVQVLIIGDEPGAAEVAAEFDLILLPEVKRSAGGTPLINSIFDLACQNSLTPLYAYINADILVLPDLLGATRQAAAQAEKFLLIGQRWDLDVRKPLSFSEGWDQRLQAETQQRGRLHLPAGSDFFIFPRSLLIELIGQLPELTVGRAGWDNWMIYFARQKGWAVIDGTPSIMIIHQDHNYSHLPGGKPHYAHPESDRNQALAGGSANLYMVLDSDWQLVDGKLRRPRWTLLRALRYAEVRLTPPDGKRQGLRWSLARSFRRLRRRITGSL